MDAGVWSELERLGVQLTNDAGPSGSSNGSRRLTASLSTRNDRFILTESGYERQFAQAYFCRYHQLKPHLQANVKKTWPNTQISRILGISEIVADEVVVCGILFKSMKLKPQVLDKYLSKKDVEKELQINKNRVHEDDVLYLEDEGTRTELTGFALPVNKLVSGICLAVKGRQLQDGKFEVMDLCYPGFAPQAALPVKRAGPEKFVALISGLNLATIGPPNRLMLEVLIQFLTSKLGNQQDIVHVIVCGGLIGKNEDLATGSPNSRQQIRALEPIIEVDRMIGELANSVPVDVMPGLYDPASFLLPQQPLHKCLFPCASNCNQFRRVTNPHDLNLDGITFLGTSGQNINDILLHSDHESGLEVLEQCLQYRHMAPTCPDTLTCFPFNQSDPFVLEDTPQVFFAGNQTSFQTKVVYGNDVTTRLICVPDFSLTSQAVLVSLTSLDTHAICLDTSLMNQIE